MFSIGIDLHKQFMRVSVLNQDRKLINQGRLVCDDERRIIEYFKNYRPFRAVIEASSSYRWLYKLLEPLAERVILAHPGKLRIIAESTKKTDKVDARLLAEFLAMDWVPEAYVVTDKEHELRQLVRHRVSLVRDLVRIKGRLKHFLAGHNLHPGNRLYTRAGHKWLTDLKLPDQDRFILNQYLAELAKVEFLIGEVEKIIKDKASDYEEIELLTTIRGVGLISAATVLAEIGNFARFRTADELCSYAGLVPRVHQSGNRRWDGHITHEGPPELRRILVESAWVAVRWDSKWREVYQRLADKRGKKIAIVAVARRLLITMFYLIRNQEKYSFAA